MSIEFNIYYQDCSVNTDIFHGISFINVIEIVFLRSNGIIPHFGFIALPRYRDKEGLVLCSAAMLPCA